jgi:hypothetical protein
MQTHRLAKRIQIITALKQAYQPAPARRIGDLLNACADIAC